MVTERTASPHEPTSLLNRGWRLFHSAAQQWWEQNTSQFGAALAFFSVFTIAPVLVLAIHLGVWFVGPEAAQARLQTQIEAYVGPSAAETIQSMVVAANQPQAGQAATLFSWLALVYGASGMFAQMQAALNAIWDVEPSANRRLGDWLRARLVPFFMVFVIAAIMLGLVVVSTVLSTVAEYASGKFPQSLAIGWPLNAVGSLAVLTLMFALIFKFVPETTIAWREVWFGAFVTAVLFWLGKYGIGYYLATFAIQSAYGAAGSVTVLLLWAYYSAQILFFGAEIAQAYTREFKS